MKVPNGGMRAYNSVYEEEAVSGVGHRKLLFVCSTRRDTAHVFSLSYRSCKEPTVVFYVSRREKEINVGRVVR